MLKFLNSYAWLGTVVILGSYFLLASGRLDGDSFFYHAMVLFGSLGVMLNSYKKNDMQPAVLNAIFVVIAIYAIVRIVL